MRTNKTFAYEDIRTMGDLRHIVSENTNLPDNARVSITKYEGDQKDPGYATITLSGDVLGKKA